METNNLRFYFYLRTYTLVGLSVLMIVLLILFLIGFLGVLCHRANIPRSSVANEELYRHTCHRGIAANFLLR
jgi:hypothetical protein